ncbi:hypothetical protein BDZ97DRAFT_1382539, partial [Flammula alnicola]
MRYEGLIKWKVLTILSLLPTLLQTALVLFFAGIIELLWMFNRIVAITVAVTIGFAMSFMAVTTIAPAIQYFLDYREESAEPSSSQCPYKSPQSWAFLQIEMYCILAFQYMKRGTISWWYGKANGRAAFSKTIISARDWFRYDLTWSRRRRTYKIGRTDVHHDLIWGLRWAATTFRGLLLVLIAHPKL